MRYFQILGGICYWDASNIVSSPEEAAERFAPDIVIVEAPDYVREGWGYDPSREGDERFLRPVPPEGWVYDEDTGTFYRPGADPAPPSSAELAAENAALLDMITDLELAMCEMYETLIAVTGG